jgi:NAD(P)-dependent dehydrogenase (short-subunit alcohol dehydrogenase family)
MKDRKVIFVTGTSRGLGKQIFEMLTHQGHSVYGASRYAKKAKNEFAIDVTDALQCQRAIEQIVAKEGRIDVVITNVGGHWGSYGSIKSRVEESNRFEFL